MVSKELNKTELLAYRCAVGARSREILSSLQSEDMKRKFPKERVAQIVIQGCLTDHHNPYGLKIFGAKKMLLEYYYYLLPVIKRGI